MASEPPHQRALRTALARYVSFSEATLDDIQSRWHPRSFAKDARITRTGEVESCFYFVLSGVQRLYYLTPEGSEVVLGFTFTNNFSGVYHSFLRQTPSECCLQALTDSQCLAINLADMTELFDRYPAMERWGRLFIQDIFFGRVQREIELTTRTAPQRYRDFIRRSPVLLQQVPQKHLASYLNMTPETFSRLRAQRIS